ncbi:MAG: nicotinamide-nucleotide amidase [Pseudonocardiales bacterium]|nr:nicotinamide-nucleotide amidase [Pseudonocardiales bacterium]
MESGAASQHPGGRPRAAVVLTGSELVTGVVADANGPWLAHELTTLGFEVAHLLVVGDRPDDLAAALRFAAAAGCALVVTSGGLGPTADDLTAELVADFADVDLVLDEALRERIAAMVARFPRLNLDVAARDAGTRKQAFVPRGATVLEPVGTAPGLVVTPSAGGPLVVVLPGPPRELTAMWPAARDSAPLKALLAGVPPATGRTLRYYGLPEAEIAATLRALEAERDLSRVEVTTCLRRSELEVDLRADPGAEDVAEWLAAALVDRHTERLISADGTSTDELLARALLDKGQTVATAESCTGGLLAGRLVDRAGSSAYVLGGIVSYSNAAKTALLGVPAELIAARGAVSPEVARAMADGARAALGADVGIGITGVAGPDGGTPDKPVGYVCLCATSGSGAVVAREVRLPGNRADVRDRSVDAGMHLLLRAVARA